MTDPTVASGIEELIRDTGGVPVVIGSASTWGHLGRAKPSQFDLSPAGGPEKLVSVPTGSLTGTPTVGMTIEVDGQTAEVLDHREVEDGKLVEIVFGSWTHTVDIYRPSASGTFSGGQQQLDPGSPIAQGVSCDIWAVSGEIRRGSFGEAAVGDWEGRFPPGTDLEPGDLIHVQTGNGPARYRAVFVGDETTHWRTPVSLEESQEDFG